MGPGLTRQVACWTSTKSGRDDGLRPNAIISIMCPGLKDDLFSVGWSSSILAALHKNSLPKTSWTPGKRIISVPFWGLYAGSPTLRGQDFKILLWVHKALNGFRNGIHQRPLDPGSAAQPVWEVSAQPSMAKQCSAWSLRSSGRNVQENRETLHIRSSY